MSLEILKKGFDKINQTEGVAASIAGGVASVAHAICIEEFLLLLSRNTAALVQFRSLLTGLVATSDQLLAGLSLAVAQLNVIKSTTDATLNLFDSTKASLTNQTNGLPFNSASNCQPIQLIKKWATQRLPKPATFSAASAAPPGAIKKIMKKYKQSKEAIRDLKYRKFYIDKQINKIQATINLIRLQVQVWNVILEAIDDQFFTGTS